MEPTRSLRLRGMGGAGKGRPLRQCGARAESKSREHSVGESVKGVVGSFAVLRQGSERL